LAARLRVTWRKSAIGYKNNQKRTIEALGLRRLGHSVEHEDSRALRGMITTVRHLVEVSEIDGAPPSHPDASKEQPEVSTE
jgi:large subunit ribosomal protein L30